MAAYKASLLLKVRVDAEMVDVGAKLTANKIKIAIIRGHIFTRDVMLRKRAIYKVLCPEDAALHLGIGHL